MKNYFIFYPKNKIQVIIQIKTYHQTKTKDVFENRSTIEYDDYQLLPLNAKQWLSGTDNL